MRLHRRPLLAFSAGVAALIGLLAAVAPSGAAAGTALPAAQFTVPSAAAMQAVPLAGNLAPRLPARVARLGAVTPDTAMHLDVMLRVPDQGALTAFLAGLGNRKSPFFHDFLRPGQFGQFFGPSDDQVATVEQALRAAGLSPGQVASDRLSIPVTATALTVERAFRVGLISYRLAGGRVAFANSAAPRLAATAAPLVNGVLGLNDLDASAPMLSQPIAAAQAPAAPVSPAGPAASATQAAPKPSAVGPQACANASKAANANGAYTASELASYYLMSPLYADGDLGRGVRVALAEIGPNLPSDIATYEHCYGIKTGVSYLKVDGGAGSGSGAPAPEAALDIEDLAGLAPGISIDVYQAPNSDAGIYEMFKDIVDTDKDKVVSASFGACEAVISSADPAYFADVTTLMDQAVTQGQTVFASAGDTGSSSCYDSNNDATPNDNFPASSPNVVAVGGTTIESGGGETVWNESTDEAGAGGGGDSSVWCMPSYQYRTAIPGVVNSHSATNSGCKNSNRGSYVREIPDVSADADPESGYVIYAAGKWQAVGGTSAAAPLWAAVAALIDASPFCADYDSGPAGVLPEGLYGMMALDHSYVYGTVPEGLVDITQGNNDYTPTGYAGGLYPAGRGFDMATGLGAPVVTGENSSGQASPFYPGLAALMCQYFATKLTKTTVTGISPNVGPAGHASTVTVHGSGFLPIAGTDRAIVGGAVLSASCSSSTTCTVTLPAESTRTVNIQIAAEDLVPSAATSADRFRYVAAPHLSGLSPGRGTHKGGTTITISGSNFIGVKAVHFGGKLGGKLRVISATEIKVVTPTGSGTVHVTVTAAGGTSNAPTYRYT
jgi:subtilase family serine protease